MKGNKNLLIIILLIIIIIILYMCNSNKIKIEEQISLNESLNASLKVWKDKDSLSHAKIQIIETSKIKDFLIIKTNDSLIKNLQINIKKFKTKLKKQGSITIVKNTTNVITSSKTENTSTNNFPEYRSKFNLNNWITGNTLSNKDSTKIDLKIKNSYSVIIGLENQGLFKKPKPFVEVINENPFTETHALRTYRVTMPRPKKIGIGPVIAVGLGVNGTFHGFIGIGIQYNIIRF